MDQAKDFLKFKDFDVYNESKILIQAKNLSYP